MEKFSQFFKIIQHASGQTVIFIGRYIGLRMPSAEPIKQYEMLRLKNQLRLLVMLIMLLAAAFVFLLHTVRASVDTMLASGKPEFDIEQLWSSWTWQSYASFGLLLLAIGLLTWTIFLFHKFRINIVFIAVVALVCMGTALWRPCARLSVEGKLMSLFNEGISLWNRSDWAQCYRYYDRLYSVFPRTFIASNCLGRMGGCDYKLSNYVSAIGMYSNLLKLFPNTEIRENVKISIKWSMRQLWQQQDPATCIKVYRDTALTNFGFSVYEFFMHNPKSGEASYPEKFGSFDDEERKDAITLMGEFPDDKWADRIAFYLGDSDTLKKRFPNSSYTVTSGVVDGWNFQKVQNYPEAEKCYVTFLNSNPPRNEQQNVRHLLALCYLASESLEAALTNLQSVATTEYSVPEKDYYLFASRFAFMESPDRMQELFDRHYKNLPYDLASELAVILAERLELSDSTNNEEIVKCRALSELLPQLNDGNPTEEIDEDDNGEILTSLPPTDDIVTYANIRLKQTRTDPSFKDYLDRFYEKERYYWPEAQNVSYTDLLHTHLKMMFIQGLDAKPDVSTKLKYAATTLEGLKDPGCLRDAVLGMVDQINSNKLELAEPQIVLLKRISKVIYSDKIDPVTARSLDAIFKASLSNNVEILSRAFRLTDIVPDDLVINEMAKQLQYFEDENTNITELWNSAQIIETDLRRAKYQTKLGRYLVPVLFDCYKRLSNESQGQQYQNAILQLAGFCLRSPDTYDLAQNLLTYYISKFPNSGFCANCHLWLAWLWCYEANKNLDLTIPYENDYHNALTNYAALVQGTHQERLSLIAQDASHKIRKKLLGVSTGDYLPTDYHIPSELTQFALQTLPIEEHPWMLNFGPGNALNQPTNTLLFFRHGLLKTDLCGQDVSVPFHATGYGGSYNFYATARLDNNESYVLQGTIDSDVASGIVFELNRDKQIIKYAKSKRETGSPVERGDEGRDKIEPPQSSSIIPPPSPSDSSDPASTAQPQAN